MLDAALQELQNEPRNDLEDLVSDDTSKPESRHDLMEGASEAVLGNLDSQSDDVGEDNANSSEVLTEELPTLRSHDTDDGNDRSAGVEDDSGEKNTETMPDPENSIGDESYSSESNIQPDSDQESEEASKVVEIELPDESSSSNNELDLQDKDILPSRSDST